MKTRFQTKYVASIFFFSFGLLLAGAGCSEEKKAVSPAPLESANVMMENKNENVNKEVTEDTSLMMDSKAEVGIYENYDSTKLALAKDNQVVLFFHAPWCPTCKAADTSFRNEKVPAKLALLKVDYDSSTDLKKKYGVTYQHTFVQVDENGNMIKKWSGSTTFSEIENELK